MQAYDRRATFCVETRFMARINIPFSVVLDTRESTRKGQNQRMIMRSLLDGPRSRSTLKKRPPILESSWMKSPSRKKKPLKRKLLKRRLKRRLRRLQSPLPRRLKRLTRLQSLQRPLLARAVLDRAAVDKAALDRPVLHIAALDPATTMPPT